MAINPNKIQVYLKEDTKKALQEYKASQGIETDSQAVNAVLGLFFKLQDAPQALDYVTTYDYRETTKRLENQIDLMSYKYFELMQVLKKIQSTTTSDYSKTTDKNQQEEEEGIQEERLHKTTNDYPMKDEVEGIQEERLHKTTNDYSEITAEYKNDEVVSVTTNEYKEEDAQGEETHQSELEQVKQIVNIDVNKNVSSEQLKDGSPDDAKIEIMQEEGLAQIEPITVSGEEVSPQGEELPQNEATEAIKDSLLDKIAELKKLTIDELEPQDRIIKEGRGPKPAIRSKEAVRAIRKLLDLKMDIKQIEDSLKDRDCCVTAVVIENIAEKKPSYTFD